MLLTTSLRRQRWFFCTVIWFNPRFPHTQPCWPTALHILILLFSGSRLSLAEVNTTASRLSLWPAKRNINECALLSWAFPLIVYISRLAGLGPARGCFGFTNPLGINPAFIASTSSCFWLNRLSGTG